MVAPNTIDEDEHPVVLEGAWSFKPEMTGPSIVQRTDENFLATTLEDLSSSTVETVVSNHRPKSETGVFKLFQPVHRTFYLALVKARCDVFMNPRLDPRKIESAGIVLRRIWADKDGKSILDGKGNVIYERWCLKAGKVLGWRPMQGGEESCDPDPKRRPVRRLTADPVFDAGFRPAPDPLAEEVTTMFVAPPETVRATGLTLLYGVIPVTSTARPTDPVQTDELDMPDNATWSRHLLAPLKESTVNFSLGMPPGALIGDDIEKFAGSFFVRTLVQLRQEFCLFREDSPARASKVIELLDQLTLNLSDGKPLPAGKYLSAAARILIDSSPPPPDQNLTDGSRPFSGTQVSTGGPHLIGKDASPQLARPTTWPAVSKTLADSLCNELRLLAKDVRQSLVAPDGSDGRFDRRSARYVVRAFIRAKRSGGCPPLIKWTADPSEAFTIAAWYESGPVAPVQISLPDPFDRNFLKNAKTGVAFSVPASLAKFLDTDAKTLLSGTGGSRWSLDWICGFNIPIITICAFIVLNIFLKLFNIVFFWMAYVKICIPFPRKK